MPTDGLHARRIRCHRCGYDLRGVAGTWADRCPLEGVCAECGLRFEWGEILNPSLAEPAWSVEFARWGWDYQRRAAKTMLMTFRPWSFWGSLRMAHPVRWRALAVYVALMIAAFYVMFCLGQGALAFQQWYGWRNPVPPLPRITYSTYEIFHAVMLPLSRRAPAPAGAPPTLLFFAPRDFYLHYWSPLVNGGLAFLLFQALCAAGFLALPVSRRMTKVRWRHVIRAAVYGVALIIPAEVLAAIAAVASGVNLFNPGTLPLVLFALGGLAAAAVLPAEVVWWSVASGRYLKLRHPWGVGAAVVLMALLATAAIIAVPALYFD